MRVLIIADDLTGALDTTVAFTGAGLRCVVARRPCDVAAALSERPDVLSVSTASREGGATAARAAVGAALDAVGTLPEILLKKVDSRLKGHPTDELGVFAARAGRSRVLIAPAIPSQGRVVVRGRLTGAGIAEPIDVAAAMAETGLAVKVPDIRVDGDFDAVLDNALGGSPALLVGAAGLAAAIARRLARGAADVPSPRLAGPILLAIGSHDPITLVQVERLAASGAATVTAAPDGMCGPLAGEAAELIQLTAAEGRPFESRVAGMRFAEEIAQLVRSGPVRTLLGCGGETADSILGALGVGVLYIEGEALPGVPVSRMVLEGRRLQLVTKSGGFGCENALVSLVAAASGPEEGEA